MTALVWMLDPAGWDGRWTTEELFTSMFEPAGWTRTEPATAVPADATRLLEAFLIPGPRGADGARGPAGPAYALIVTQTAPSAAWPIAHNLGRVPAVTVVVDGEQVLADVVHIDSNNASVVLAEPASGLAILS